MKGKFQPKNPSKYKGNPTNIIFRSKWEADVFRFCDMNTDIVKWSSEEIIIPYVSPLDGRVHRYFPDIWVQKADKSCMIIEIKPYKQTLEPEIPKRKSRAFLNEAATYVVNQAKWKAANEYCKDRGWKFTLMTEKEIYGK
jgi:hypothetical protein